ncbi:tetratricopeptide repeat-containing serine protease family protein [Nostoc sp.]|uniref:tetratricopeptide repeat-containing serine protease family protein n=1 Tax=Nostoc sp. TaxID=1180 RepID=UPI002FF6514B
MPTGLETAIVRICRSNGVVVGAGFLVSSKHVITCAHVVADALGISRDTQKRPTEVVYLDFPLIAPEESLTGKVVLWRPVPPKGSTSVKGKEDIAGLELNGTVPEAAQPVDLIIEEDLRNHSFRTFGFPAGHDDGLEATGVLRGRQGTGWIQIEDIKETGVRLEPGFSGAPIWDEKLNGIVGMAVAADQKRPEAKVAFMIPTKVIATAWPALAQQTIPPLILSKDKRFIFWRDRSWILTSIILFSLTGGVFMITQKNTTSIVTNDCTDKLQNQEIVNKIVIANFNNVDINSGKVFLTEDRLLDQLKRDHAILGIKIKVCPTKQIVSNSQEAHSLGKEQNATLVIWGSKDSSSLRINLEGIEEEIQYLNQLKFPLVQASEFSVQDQDIPNLISVMAAYGLSMNYYLNQQIPKARLVLQNALNLAESRKIGKNNEYNAKKIAEAYFLLAIMFEINTDQQCKNYLENCRNALSYYRKSIEYSTQYSGKYSGKPYQSFLNKGILYENLDEPEEAKKTYSRLIDLAPQSDSAVEALFYRSLIYLNENKNVDALRDLEKVCQREPEETKYYHYLGLAQLKLGKWEQAKKTYVQVKKYMTNQELKDEIIANLNSLSEEAKNPEATKTIRIIVSTLL